MNLQIHQSEGGQGEEGGRTPQATPPAVALNQENPPGRQTISRTTPRDHRAALLVATQVDGENIEASTADHKAVVAKGQRNLDRKDVSPDNR